MVDVCVCQRDVLATNQLTGASTHIDGEAKLGDREVGLDAAERGAAEFKAMCGELGGVHGVVVGGARGA